LNRRPKDLQGFGNLGGLSGTGFKSIILVSKPEGVSPLQGYYCFASE